MTKPIRTIGVLILATGLCIVAISAQSDGIVSYELKKQTIASGGGVATDTTNNIFAVTGTVAQPIAAPKSSGALYGVSGGFWSGNILPSAAGVAVSGRVVTSEGRGLRGAIIRLTGNDTARPRMVATGVNGTFSFTDVEPGHTYIISVSSRRFGFANPTQVITVNDNVADILFTAGWQN